MVNIKSFKLFESIEKIKISDFESVKKNLLSKREKSIIYEVVDREWFLENVEIYKEDFYYYCKYTWYWRIGTSTSQAIRTTFRFDTLDDLLSYLYLVYRMDTKELTVEDLKSSPLDLYFDHGWLLNRSCEFGLIEVVNFLLNTNLRIDIGNGPIRAACGKGHADIVKILLKDPRVDPSCINNECIRNSASYGHTEVVKILLQDPRVDPTVIRNAPLLSAAHSGNIEMIKLFLKDPRVNPAVDDNYIIKFVPNYLSNRKEVIRLLIRDSRVSDNLTNEEIEKYMSI